MIWVTLNVLGVIVIIQKEALLFRVWGFNHQLSTHFPSSPDIVIPLYSLLWGRVWGVMVFGGDKEKLYCTFDPLVKPGEESDLFEPF